MKNLRFIFLIFPIFWGCNELEIVEPLQETQQNVISLNYKKSETVSRAIGGEPCIVKGDCASFFCSARIECGCDETPKCNCSWSSCDCDCEKKGRQGTVEPVFYAVELYEDYLDNMASLEILSLNSTFEEVQAIAAIVQEILSAVDNTDLLAYSTSSKYLYSYVNDIQDESAKTEINEWFNSRGINYAI